MAMEYWYMFPIGILFSTIAMMTGVGGASMFTPFFFLVLGLPASVAVGSGLLIEAFGFMSGLIGFAREKLIAYKIGRFLLVFTIPATIIGVLASKAVPEWLIMGIFSVLLIMIAVSFLHPERNVLRKHHTLVDRCKHHKEQCYTEPRSRKGIWELAALGGMLAGMVSTGVGEMNDYILIKKYRMHGALATGTSVFVVALTVLIGAAAHAYALATGGSFDITRVLYIVAFAVPGVILGAQIGVHISEKIGDSFRKKFIAGLFLVLALVTLASLVL